MSTGLRDVDKTIRMKAWRWESVPQEIRLLGAILGIRVEVISMTSRLLTTTYQFKLCGPPAEIQRFIQILQDPHEEICN